MGWSGVNLQLHNKMMTNDNKPSDDISRIDMNSDSYDPELLKEHLRNQENEMALKRNPDQFSIDDEDARMCLAVATNLKAQGSYDQNESSLRKYVNFITNTQHIRPESATIEDLREFFYHCVADRLQRRKTIKNDKAAIKRYYRYLQLAENRDAVITPEDVELALTDAILEACPEPIKRISIPREEVRLLFEHADDPSEKLLFRYLYETSGRNSDVRFARVTSVNFERLIVTFPKTKYNRKHTVPITSELALRTKHWMETEREQRTDKHDSGYLFVRPSGHQLTNSDVAESVKEAAVRAGIQDVIGYIHRYNEETGEVTKYKFYRVTPHTLRHSIITHLGDDKVKDEIVQRLSGHENLVNLWNYKHTDPELKKLRTSLEQI